MLKIHFTHNLSKDGPFDASEAVLKITELIDGEERPISSGGLLIQQLEFTINAADLIPRVKMAFIPREFIIEIDDLCVDRFPDTLQIPDALSGHRIHLFAKQYDPAQPDRVVYTIK